MVSPAAELGGDTGRRAASMESNRATRAANKRRRNSEKLWDRFGAFPRRVPMIQGGRPTRKEDV